MSRIVYGASPEVKSVRVLPRQTSAEGYSGPVFQSFGLAGTLTEEETRGQLAAARAEGAREAEVRMTAPLRAGLENVERVLDEVSQFRRELFKESEEDILELVRAIAKRVVLKEISIDPSIMKSVVEKALGILEKQKKISLQIHPQDFDFYQQAKPDFLSKFKGIEEFDLSVDPDVPQGSAVLKSKTLELDVKLDAMVDHLLTQVQTSKVQVQQVNDEGDSV